MVVFFLFILELSDAIFLILCEHACLFIVSSKNVKVLNKINRLVNFLSYKEKASAPGELEEAALYRPCLAGLHGRLHERLWLEPCQTVVLAPALSLELQLEPLAAYTGEEKPQNRGFVRLRGASPCRCPFCPARSTSWWPNSAP